jgi:hypothetical protein
LRETRGEEVDQAIVFGARAGKTVALIVAVVWLVMIDGEPLAIPIPYGKLPCPAAFEAASPGTVCPVRVAKMPAGSQLSCTPVGVALRIFPGVKAAASCGDNSLDKLGVIGPREASAIETGLPFVSTL